MVVSDFVGSIVKSIGTVYEEDRVEVAFAEIVVAEPVGFPPLRAVLSQPLVVPSKSLSFVTAMERIALESQDTAVHPESPAAL